MLQIRLSKGGGGHSGDGGGLSGGKSAAVVETVTVACPDHLVLADLPVAKSLGAVTASSVRSVGRRSRRHLGERVHFCVRCDFPIAIYGRLMPCEHVFCLACARTDSSCYLCDERIQKIQTIKLMEGIFVCAAPHCLKSFLKRADFEAHVHETHADLLRSNEKEGGSENNAFNATKPPSTDAQKQSLQPEVSTARAPPKSGFSPSSNSQQQDREDMTHRHQSRDPPPRPPLQPKPPPFQGHQQPQSGDPQAENPPQGFDRPYNWFPQPPNGPPYQQNPDQFSSDKATGIPPEALFPNFPPLPHQPMNYTIPLSVNQALVPSAPFPFAPFPTDGSKPYYAVTPEMPRPDSAIENGSEQGSILGNPPAPTAIGGFPDNLSCQWGMGFMAVPFQPLQMGQGIPEGFGNPMEPQSGVAFFPGDFSRLPEGMAMMNPPLPAKEPEHQGGLAADRNDGKGLLAMQPPTLAPPLPLPPPPPLPPHMSQQQQQQQQQQQLNRSRDIPPGFGWPNDKRGPD